MGGRRVERARLVHGFGLERHMPGGHLLPRLDAALGLSGLRAGLAASHSLAGRPSTDDAHVPHGCRTAVNPSTLHGNSGALGRIRTPDPLIRSQVLYPTELPARDRVGAV